MQATLYYAHDPMCSWCWAYRPTWDRVRVQLAADVKVIRLLGGLAPDTDQPMPQMMQKKLQDTWRQIQSHVPATKFNFDFWTECRPRRSTYPACRAVIAASNQGEDWYDPMVSAIQHCYYLYARNPSEDETLIALATEAGLDPEQFRRDLKDPETNAELHRQIQFCQQLGLFGFPGLVLQHNGRIRQVQVDMNNPELQLELIRNGI